MWITLRGINAAVGVCLGLVLAFACSAVALAGSATDWGIAVGPAGSGGVVGSPIGVHPWAVDGYGDTFPANARPDSRGIFLLLYRQQGPDWSGPTGFYSGDLDHTPVPAGGTRTWSDFYLWAQNYTPTAGNVVGFYCGPGYTPPPAGYRGHLVLDYVPDSCNWTGKPMDYWVDLTVNSEIALPIPVVTDPLQGTRFHLDVYAPVPEPSCLAALATGLAGIAGAAIRRRRP